MTVSKRPPVQKESDFARAFEDFLRLKGWRFAHFRPAPDPRSKGRWRTPMQGDPGFPDYVLVREGSVIIVELKSDRGKLTPEQTIWINGLRAKLPCFVWRPSDWPYIEQVLA